MDDTKLRHRLDAADRRIMDLEAQVEALIQLTARLPKCVGCGWPVVPFQFAPYCSDRCRQERAATKFRNTGVTHVGEPCDCKNPVSSVCRDARAADTQDGGQ